MGRLEVANTDGPLRGRRPPVEIHPHEVVRLGVLSLQGDDAVPGLVVDQLDDRTHRSHLGNKLHGVGFVYLHQAVVECHEEAVVRAVYSVGLPLGREQVLRFHIVETTQYLHHFNLQPVEGV